MLSAEERSERFRQIMADPENHVWGRKGHSIVLPDWHSFTAFNTNRVVSKIYSYYFLNIIYALIWYLPFWLGMACLGNFYGFDLPFWAGRDKIAGIVLLACLAARIILAPFNIYRMKYLLASTLEVRLDTNETRDRVKFTGSGMIRVLKRYFLSSILVEIILTVPMLLVIRGLGIFEIIKTGKVPYSDVRFLLAMIALLIY